MKPSYLFIVFFLAVAPLPGANEVPRLHDEYDPAKWPPAVLKLSQAATLKDIFDSGLRPYRHPGLENSLLEIKHLNLVIQLGSGNLLPELPLELMNLTPFRDDEIATMEGFTPRLTLEQARNEMLKWLPYSTNGRTEKDLDDFLNAVGADFLNFDHVGRGPTHRFSVNWKEPGWKTRNGGGQVTTWFRKTATLSFPLRLCIKLSWESNRSIKDSNSIHDGPIAPPPGYENVNMTAPKKIGPDSMVEMMRTLNQNTGESPEAVAEQRRIGERPPLKAGQGAGPTAAPPHGAPISPPEASSGLFMKLALGFAAACLLGWWYLKRTKPAP